MKNRKSFFNKGKKTFAIVGDGDCEKWYFQLLKDAENLIINIRPELIKKASLKKQYEYVKELSENYDKVFWIVDYDVIERESRECKIGEEKRSNEFARYYAEISKIKKVEIMVVNTCFEFWLLLHFKYSKKQFSDCDQTQKELEKIFKGYQKTEKFYKQSNNIYNQLKDKLPEAVINASKLGNFDIKNPNNPVCEIYKLFNKDGSFNTNLK